MPLMAVNGVNLFYDLAGPDGSPVVVFSNSLGTSAEMWAGMQMQFDLYQASKVKRPKIDRLAA